MSICVFTGAHDRRDTEECDTLHKTFEASYHATHKHMTEISSEIAAVRAPSILNEKNIYEYEITTENLLISGFDRTLAPMFAEGD